MIYGIEGHPGEGKTVFCTLLVLESMNDKTARGVFTVYPVHDVKTGRISRQWHREYVFEPIFDSDIFIDEAALPYPSRGSGKKYVESTPIYKLDQAQNIVRDDNGKEIVVGWKFDTGVTHEEHMMWAGSRHNGNNFYFVSQSLNRLDIIIRELIEKNYRVKKIRVPILSKLPFIKDFFDWPLAVRIETFDDITDNKAKPIEVTTLWNFPGSRLRKVFKSYDTQFMRSKGTMRLEDYPEWTNDVDMKEYILRFAGILK